MSWRADQVYSLPRPQIIDFWKNIEILKERLFVVKDFAGIRSEWTKEAFGFAESEPHKICHNLPPDGLMVVAPHIYKTRYNNESKDDTFWKTNSVFSNKWSVLEKLNLPIDPRIPQLTAELDIEAEHLHLFAALQELNKITDIPQVFYKCEMWAGGIEDEFSLVFDKEMYVYYYQTDSNSIEVISGKKIALTPLQSGLRHLGLKLPTSFFALHETSLSWQSYHLSSH